MGRPSAFVASLALAGLALATLGEARAEDARSPGSASASASASPRPAEAAAASASAKGAASAAPTSPVLADVVVLVASNSRDGKGSIDPRIGSVPALAKPPFSSYDTYRFVSRSKLAIERTTPATSTLPNGRVVQISLRDVLGDGRMRVATSINQPGGSTFLPLLEVVAPAGETFFVAGQSFQGGVLVVGITMSR